LSSPIEEENEDPEECLENDSVKLSDEEESCNMKNEDSNCHNSDEEVDFDKPEGDYVGSGCKPLRINGVEYTVKSCVYGDETDQSSEKEVNVADLYEPILDWSLNLGCQEAEEDFLGIPRKHDVWEEMKFLKEEIAKLERILKKSGDQGKRSNVALNESTTN
jgi:hypothetical protein